MRRYTALLNIIVVASMLALTAGPVSARPGVVIKDGARLLGGPSVGGKEVRRMKRGDIIEILAETKNMETIGGASGVWLSVRQGALKGWIFGPFVASGREVYCDAARGTVAWMEREMSACGDGGQCLVVMNASVNPKIDCTIRLTGDNCGFDIDLSKDLRYVAVDCGTDVVGTLEIYSVRYGRLVHSATYTRHPFKWKGGTISYQKVTYLGDGCLRWEEEIFDDGVVKKGAKKGKGKYHGSGKSDPKCH